MNDPKAFFDTNILLYVYGGDDAGKRAVAAQIFRSHTRTAQAVISTQVVQEFYSVATRKLGVPRDVARAIVRDLLNLPIVNIGAECVLTALGIEDRYRISFWDALIIAAAEAADASVLFTEDLNDGQQYGTVVARNPFSGATNMP